MTVSPTTAISAARYYLTKRWPDFDAIYSLAMVAHPGLGTMALTDGGVILYDPAVIVRQRTPQIAADLMHELGHFLRQHSTRRGDRDAQKWNLSADAEINDDLAACGADLSFVEFVQAEHLGCRRGLTAEMYYAAQQQPGTARPKQCPCGGGSGVGSPVPGEPTAGPLSGQPLVAELVRQRTAEKIQKSAGRYGADWSRWADDTLKPAKVSWQSKLGAGLRGAFAARPGASQRTYSVASRKQAGVGRPGAGVPVLRGRGSTSPEVAVVVDTSASMGPDELASALSETQAIVRAAGGRIRYLTADTRVCAEADLRDILDARKITRGGGGTDFRPAFEHLAKAQPRPEVVIYATDGFGPAPEAAPSWCRTIWALIGRGALVPAVWGTVVRVEGDDEQ